MRTQKTTLLPFIRALFILMGTAFFLVPQAHGEVVCWEEIDPGVDWCAETLTPPGSSDEVTVHWAVIDLTEPTLYVRVTREEEGPLTTSDAAALFGSSVTLNGDWHDSVWGRPLGLSVGHGWRWTGTHDWDNSINPPGDWSFLACTADKSCRFNPVYTNEEWVLWRDLNIIGGNGARLVVDGVLKSPSFDNNRRPRSGVCLNAEATEMRLYASEGECVSCNVGFTPSDFAAYVFEKGCWSGMMLDGGGSTDLVIKGIRVGDRPVGEPDERLKYNHLSIVHNTDVDTACATVMNGRVCQGSIVHTCTAGHDDPVDCSFFGQTCEEGLGSAYCVDPKCTNGAHADACIDDDSMARCQYGQVFPYACVDLFGSSCEETDDGAQCVMAGCDFGGDATWCDGDLLKVCAPLPNADPAISTLATTDCAETGQICDPDALSCIDIIIPPDTSDSEDAGSIPDPEDAGSIPDPEDAGSIPDPEDAGSIPDAEDAGTTAETPDADASNGSETTSQPGADIPVSDDVPTEPQPDPGKPPSPDPGKDENSEQPSGDAMSPDVDPAAGYRVGPVADTGSGGTSGSSSGCNANPKPPSSWLFFLFAFALALWTRCLLVPKFQTRRSGPTTRDR